MIVNKEIYGNLIPMEILPKNNNNWVYHLLGGISPKTPKGGKKSCLSMICMNDGPLIYNSTLGGIR